MDLKVSYSWLKDYVKLEASPKEFAARLSLSGPSVERLHPQGAGLENVVVGKILKVKPHPNADKLRVVETDLGSMTKDIVCGGSNLVEGQLVAVALPGSWVKWHGQGEPVEIKEAALRGVSSYGMICGADEIGLAGRFPKGSEREILDLTSVNAKPGTPLAEALKLDDVILDVEVTSNRPDAFCMVGMARETAAILEVPFLWKQAPAPKPKAAKKGEKTDALPLSVSVTAKKLCPRYQALVMTGAKVGPSPEWLQQRLLAAGHHPINNLVDITNYVRLELGQPMHVFDYEKIGGHAIVVREAKEGETLKALDGNSYALKAGQLVIADEAKPVAVAGVMGGEASGTTEATRTIVFESAAFDSVSVRRTARALGLHSDSSQLYEKGLSTELTSPALARAAQLAAELAGATAASAVIDAKAAPYKAKSYPFRPSRAVELIGVALKPAEMKRTLTRLGFGVTGTGASWRVTVPYWRDHDIEGERDLVEEVARVHGYGNLPSVMPDGTLPLMETAKTLVWEDRVKRTLKGWGLTELMTYSFISEALADKTRCDTRELVRISNPLTEEFEFLRDRLMGSVLAVVAENQEERVEGQAFELANIYLPRQGDLPSEEPRLAIVSWSRDESGADVYRLKGVVEALCDELGIRGLAVARGQGSDLWHPGRSASLEVKGMMIGGFGELHPELLKGFGIERRVAFASLDFTILADLANETKSYSPIPEYPRVKRDLAFVVDRRVEHEKVADRIRQVDPLIADVELFDVFEGENVGKGKKSMAYHLAFGADRTLKTEEVDAVMEGLRVTLKKDFGAEARS